MVKSIIFMSLCVSNLLMQCGYMEANPVPKYSSLTFCHWNTNGLTAHDNIKGCARYIFASCFRSKQEHLSN